VIDGVTIIRVGRNYAEGFEEVKVDTAEADLHMRRFLICRQLYAINAEIKG
jgi:hypothetical protein